MEKWDIHYLRHIRNILALFAIMLLIFIFKAGGEIIIPFVISVFIFLLVNPILNKLDRLKVPNLLSIITVLVLVVLIFVVFVYTVFQMVNTLLSRIGTYAERVAEFDAFISVYLARLFDADPEGYSFLASLNIDWLSDQIFLCFLTALHPPQMGGDNGQSGKQRDMPGIPQISAAAGHNRAPLRSGRFNPEPQKAHTGG